MLSVVIVTFNRSKVLKNLLDKLKLQSDKKFEVVIGIDGSTDDTIDMLKLYKKNAEFPIKWIDTKETKKYCLAKARNMAILETKGRGVVVIDDDSYPDVNFVKEHRKSLKPKTITGGCRSSHDPNSNMHAKMSDLKKKYGHMHPKKLKGEMPVENNCSMLRKDWLACGMFSERFEGYGGCGQEFFKRLSYQGYYYQYNKNAKIFHHSEFEGDNGLTRAEKIRQVRSTRPTLDKHIRDY